MCVTTPANNNLICSRKKYEFFVVKIVVCNTNNTRAAYSTGLLKRETNRNNCDYSIFMKNKRLLLRNYIGLKSHKFLLTICNLLTG